MTSNNSATSRNGATDMGLEKDTRPEHSPYASELCTVSFKDGKSLHIPRELLHKVNQFYVGLHVNPGYKPCLNEISSETGHVLIHFLICGAYQCLRPQGDSPEKRRASEFRTALDVYVAAESLLLPRLRDLARREITRLGDNMSLPSIISAIEDSGRSLKTLPGVAAYVESRIISFGEEATPEVVDEMLVELEWPGTLSKALLKAMVLLKSSELSRKQQRFYVDEGQGSCETDKSVSEEGMERKKISPTEQAMKDAEAKAAAEAEEAEAKAAAEAEEAILAAIEEEEEAELQTLRDKKSRKGKLTKTNQDRLDVLQERSERRVEARRRADSERQVTVDPSFTFPAMDVTPTSEPFEHLNVETEAQEAKTSDTPSSRSSGNWSL